MSVCKGTCKWFDSTKGYGFITTEHGEELFVHQSEIRAKGFRSLSEGEPVECVLVEENGRKKATNVTAPGGGFVKGDADRQGRGGNRRDGNGGGGFSNRSGGGRNYSNNNGGSNNYYQGGGGGGYNNYERGNNFNEQYGGGRDL